MPDILIVDDKVKLLDEILENLSSRGWKVEGVPDGHQAIDVLSRKSFHAVVLDRSMPGLSGDDVLRWIRSRRELQDLCVIMLTGYGNVGSAVESLKLGAFQYLQKPVEADQLRSILAAGIAWHRAHAMRRDLLASVSSQVFRRVRSILIEALQPDEVHIKFLGKDGALDTEDPRVNAVSGRRFVERILSGAPVVFEEDPSVVRELDPFLPGARTLMAVPLPGANGAVVGVLDMESTLDHAFDPAWTEVLRYLGDLTGLCLEIESQTRKVLEVEREAARDKQQQLELLYREFRHSIATHVQIIAMQARELLDGKLTALPPDLRAQIEQRATFIHNNANVVETVVQDLRALYAELPGLNRRETDLVALVRECVAGVSPALKESGIDVVLPDRDSHVVLMADPVALSYAVTCLINNAIEAITDKRTYGMDDDEALDDSIAIRMRGGESSVEIDVSDTGIGFDAAGKAMLFKPLYSTKPRVLDPSAQQEVRGRERIERVLGLLGELTGQLAETPALAAVHEGTDILIRDRDHVSMFVRQGPTPSNVTLGEFETDSLNCIRTSSPLGGERPNRGIGLYSAQRIALQHGGHITPYSAGVGAGATFTIALPRGT